MEQKNEEWWKAKLAKDLEAWKQNGVQTVIFPSEVYNLFEKTFLPEIIAEAQRRAWADAKSLVQEEISKQEKLEGSLKPLPYKFTLIGMDIIEEAIDSKLYSLEK